MAKPSTIQPQIRSAQFEKEHFDHIC